MWMFQRSLPDVHMNVSEKNQLDTHEDVPEKSWFNVHGYVSEKSQRGEKELLKENTAEIKELRKELREQELQKEQLRLEYQEKMEVRG